MKPEEQRIAIAEACGWKSRLVPREEGYGHATWWDHPTQKGTIPDYLNDLNAMHEAEKVAIIPARLWYQYCLKLPGRSFDESIGATATQRAEAFLKTLNLWKD